MRGPPKGSAERRVPAGRAKASPPASETCDVCAVKLLYPRVARALAAIATAAAVAVALTAVLAGAALIGATPASAAPLDVLGFRLSSPLLFVNEDAGDAVITVTRINTSQVAQVRYITTGLTAIAPYDYTPEKAMLSFAKGQSTASFDVPIIDHGIDALPSTLTVSLFGPSPIGLGIPSSAVLTILNDDPVPVTSDVSSDPLQLPAASTATDPLAGAHFYVDPQGEAVKAAEQDPAIKAIAEEPGAARFGNFSYPNATVAVQRYLARAQSQEPGTVPILTTYRVVDGHCGNWSDTPADVTSYERFIDGFAAGIGSSAAVLALEQDSLITVGCLSKHGVAVRMQELRYAIDTLTANCPHLIIYLDAGAADAVPARQMASLLTRAGIAKIQGFFLDATHFDWTLNEIHYGDEISKLTGGKHFIVSTGESGQGPLVPKDRVKDGNEVLCNPAGRGLGPRPTTATGFPRVDAFVWLDNPGGSSGACVPGAPPAGNYWPKYALMLVRNADYAVR
jgi:endoglucanase